MESRIEQGGRIRGPTPPPLQTSFGSPKRRVEKSNALLPPSSSLDSVPTPPSQPFHWAAPSPAWMTQEDFMEQLMEFTQPSHSATQEVKQKGAAFYQAWSDLQGAAQNPELQKASQAWMEGAQKRFQVRNSEQLSQAVWKGLKAQGLAQPEPDELPDALNRCLLRRAALGDANAAWLENPDAPPKLLPSEKQASQQLFETLSAHAHPNSPLPSPGLLGNAVWWPTLLKTSAAWSLGGGKRQASLKNRWQLLGSPSSGGSALGVWGAGMLGWTGILLQERNLLSRSLGALVGGLSTWWKSPPRGTNRGERMNYAFQALGQGAKTVGQGVWERVISEFKGLSSNFHLSEGAAQVAGGIWSCFRWK